VGRDALQAVLSRPPTRLFGVEGFIIPLPDGVQLFLKLDPALGRHALHRRIGGVGVRACWTQLVKRITALHPAEKTRARCPRLAEDDAELLGVVAFGYAEGRSTQCGVDDLQEVLELLGGNEYCGSTTQWVSHCLLKPSQLLLSEVRTVRARSGARCRRSPRSFCPVVCRV